MLEFKKWILNEIVELRKPNGSIKKSFRNNIIELSFVTSLKNEVKVTFFKKQDQVYEVSFYVNESYEKTERNEILGRDPEILPGVLYLIKEKADEINIKKIYFQSYEDKNDSKIISNINLNPIKNKVFSSLEEITNETDNQDLIIINYFKELVSNLKSDTSCLDFLNQINIYFGKILTIFNKLQKDSFEFYFNTNELRNAITSYKHGIEMIKNRRSSVYEKLFNRFFNKDWDLKMNGNNFEITRKTNEF
jgi:hypothetical protein